MPVVYSPNYSPYSPNYNPYSPNLGNMILTSDSPYPFIPSVSLGNPYFNNIITVPVTQIQPTITIPIDPSLNLNLDPQIHQQLTKYFYGELMDIWLFEDMVDILNYLKNTPKGIDVLDSLKDYHESNIDKDTQDIIEKKIRYIENNFFSKESMFKLLKRYVLETNTNWFDLSKNKYFIKDLVRSYLRKKLKRAIESKMSTK